MKKKSIKNILIFSLKGLPLILVLLVFVCSFRNNQTYTVNESIDNYELLNYDYLEYIVDNSIENITLYVPYFSPNFYSLVSDYTDIYYNFAIELEYNPNEIYCNNYYQLWYSVDVDIFNSFGLSYLVPHDYGNYYIYSIPDFFVSYVEEYGFGFELDGFEFGDNYIICDFYIDIDRLNYYLDNDESLIFNCYYNNSIDSITYEGFEASKHMIYDTINEDLNISNITGFDNFYTWLTNNIMVDSDLSKCIYNIFIYELIIDLMLLFYEAMTFIVNIANKWLEDFYNG